MFKYHPITDKKINFYLAPKLLIESTSYHASLKENDDSLLVPLGKFKVQVVPPCFQLNPLQRLDMEVWPLELESSFRMGPRLNKSTAYTFTLTASSNFTLFATSSLVFSNTVLLFSITFSFRAFSSSPWKRKEIEIQSISQ